VEKPVSSGISEDYWQVRQKRRYDGGWRNRPGDLPGNATGFRATRTSFPYLRTSPLSPGMLQQPTNNVSYQLQNITIMGNIIPIMARTEPPLLPRLSRLLRGYGENLKLARLRRRYSAETVAQRASITRKTLSRVEKGESAVSLGIYARVMQVLRLEEDLAKLAVDDPLGRKLQDTGLSPKRRAPKRPSSPTLSVDSDKQPKETS
jgi:transcriptional regulator with XRE-family HTH domain